MSGTDASALIRIRASAKNNGLTSVLLGGMGLCGSYLLLASLPEPLFLVPIFTSCLSIVALVIGWFKLREPPNSLLLSRQQLCYHHRCGQWSLAWQNIQRIDIPKSNQGVSQQPLELVGIRLKQYQPLLQHISPRLATNILMQQRPLLLHAEDKQCASGGCYDDSLIEADSYRLDDGQVIRGVTAMLANRMNKLRQALGYDLFIPAEDLDRPVGEFVHLLRQCKQQVDSQQGDQADEDN